VRDHINIQHPDYRGVESQTYPDRLEIEKLRAELKQLRMYHDAVCSDLESIFNRIGEGLTAELHYPDGRIIAIAVSVSPMSPAQCPGEAL
jgi:hypothetical protein